MVFRSANNGNPWFDLLIPTIKYVLLYTGDTGSTGPVGPRGDQGNKLSNFYKILL